VYKTKIIRSYSKVYIFPLAWRPYKSSNEEKGIKNKAEKTFCREIGHGIKKSKGKELKLANYRKCEGMRF